jgi:pterin-4a-carbinolamine dehydratase
MKKLSKEELEKYSNAHTEYARSIEACADVLVRESRLKTYKETSLMNHDIAENAIREIRQEIEAKYGKVHVNMKTGELS